MNLMAGVPEQAKGMGVPQAGETAAQAGEEACGAIKPPSVLSCQLSPYFLDLQPHWFSWLPNLRPYISPFCHQWFSVPRVGR